MLTRAEAIEQGYTVDNHAIGRPIAYKGRRFCPTAVQGVMTDLEERMLVALRQTFNDPLFTHLGQDVRASVISAINEVLRP